MSSATYTVTFTATDSAAIDDWALRQPHMEGERRTRRRTHRSQCVPSCSTLLSSVSGEGVDGSAGFDVTFGYTGDYTAAAHGLEAASVFTDNVVQDPDQTL